ncbi:MAG TPA: four helix bundle protein [Thermoanaerobaculia bacterium]
MDIQDRALDFACEIVMLHQELMRRRGAARHLAGQLLRSGTSVGSNLEEADAGQSRADFISKCRVSLKEARESLYWLKLLHRSKLGPQERTESLVQEADEIVSILTVIIRKAAASRA